jgi:predicted transcriptional regulator of viral defense system
MKTSEFNDFLSRNNIHLVTIVDAAKIIGKSRAYASLFLFRNKRLRLAERGLYYTREATEYEVASNIVYPSYISLVSALRFHNATQQMPNIIYVITTKRHKPIKNLNGYRVEFKNVKKELMFGYRKVDDVFVADLEKAIIDMYYLNLFNEYADETLESDKINMETVWKYAEMTKVNTIKKHINFALSAMVTA